MVLSGRTVVFISIVAVLSVLWSIDGTCSLPSIETLSRHDVEVVSVTKTQFPSRK